MRLSLSTTIAAVVLLFAVSIGAWLRTAQLDLRPMHTDEAIQADRLGRLIEGEGFDYNPHDGHGPGLLYLAAPVAALLGAENYVDLDERTLRMTPALCGIATVGIAALFWPLLGAAGVAVAGLLTALSPMQVYYSRYFIMEIPMVLMLAVFLLCAWRYLVRPGYGWMIGAGISCALMHATKETFAISVGAFALAYGIVFALGWIRNSDAARLPLRPLLAHLGTGVAVCLLVSAALYSQLFTRLDAVVQSYATYGHYLQRSEGAGHEKPFWYYAKLLAWLRLEKWTWTEMLILALAAVGCVAAFTNRPRRDADGVFVRTLAIYAVLTLLIYSAISYKTPWSILAFLHAAVLLAGIGFAALMRWMPLPGQVVVAAAVAAGSWNLYSQDRVADFQFPAEEDRNPYVYGHTSTSLVNKLVAQVEELRAIKPDLTIQVFHPESGWPLPYYFRHIERAGYWPELTGEIRADVVIIDEAYDEAIQPLLGERYSWPELRNLRENVMLVMYIEKGLFDEMVERRSQPSP